MNENANMEKWTEQRRTRSKPKLKLPGLRTKNDVKTIMEFQCTLRDDNKVDSSIKCMEEDLTYHEMIPKTCCW